MNMAENDHPSTKKPGSASSSFRATPEETTRASGDAAREDGALFPRRPGAVPMGIAVAAAGLALVAIPFAEQVWNTVYPFIKELRIEGILAVARQFAVTATIASICIIIWALDRPRRGAVVVFLVALAIAAGLNQGIKHTVRRARPDHGICMGSGEKAEVEALIRKYPQTAAKSKARDQWLLFSPHPPFFSTVYNSFPSGHANAAFVLAAFLTVLYPRLAWLWILWAVGCGLGRIEGRMHYPEDVLFGCATGWIVASVVFSWRWPARLGRRIASRFSG